MRVHRDFRDPDIVRILESIDEAQLSALLREDEADAELIAAIEHSKATAKPDDYVSAKAFLTDETGKH